MQKKRMVTALIAVFLSLVCQSVFGITVKGKVLRDLWTGIPGTSISDIPGSFPGKTDYITGLQTGGNWESDYGEKLYAYLEAPVTGNYTFWIASSGDAELWISDDAKVMNKQLRAAVSGGTNPDEWDKYPGQRSLTLSLDAGRLYYIEVLHKTGSGPDHLSVGWARPGEGAETPSEIVPAAVLHPRPRLNQGTTTDDVSYISELWFIDLFKHSSAPFCRPDAGGPYLNPADLETDENGYVVEVPFIHNGESISHVAYALPASSEDGNYVCLYEGEGEIFFSGAATLVSSAPGRLELSIEGAHITPGEEERFPWLFIGSSERGNHIRNIRVVPAEHEETYEENPWHPVRLEVFKEYSTLRWMGTTSTNGAGKTTWEKRKTPGYSTQMSDDTSDGSGGNSYNPYGFGLAYEYVIDFSNRQGKNVWINVPHQATEEYNIQMARLFRDTLDPELTIYVEYSNEVWNWMFSQAHWVLNDPELVALYGEDSHSEKYAYKYNQMADAWETVFIGEDRNRVVFVAACQKGWTYSVQLIIDESIRLGRVPDALSPSGYFGLSDENRDVLAALGENATAEDVMREAAAYRVLNTDWSDIIEYAKQRGINRFPIYEGGQHLTDYQIYSYTPALRAATVHPWMYEEYIKNFNEVQETGCELFCNLTPFGVVQAFGHFISMDSYLNDYDHPDNVKGHAVMDSNGVSPVVSGPFDPPPPVQAENLALNKPAVASSEEVPGGEFLPGHVTDGMEYTGWSSRYEDPSWIYVDLGGIYVLNRVILEWETAFGSAYEIQVSNDALEWTTIYSTNAGDGATDDISLTGTGRYVRMYGTQRGTQWGYNLFEFEVYGSPSTGPLLETPGNPAAVPGVHSIVLNWDSVEGALGYTLYYTLDGTEPTKNSDQIGGLLTNSFTHSGLDDQVLYSYKISAGDGDSESALSETVTAQALPLPPSPTGPVFIRGDRTVSGISGEIVRLIF